MEKLIPIINQLQDVFTAVGTNPVDLPQIVVIGSQSSGKSSVLESFVGKDFLPRGTGICTRRPLILQLVHTESLSGISDDSKNNHSEWGVFLHLPLKKIFDFTEIRDEIVRETERITGINKGISSKPINLKIFSPKVLNLTLVDLPGITKVAVGDQPEDIETQIREMIFHYISNPNSIILAVTAANTDIATSDSLQMSKQVDPLGMRTLGVLTKIDLMDHGCNALEQLHGKVVPLKLGYIGVKNRSQLDINNNVSIEHALEEENRYFRTHSAYRSISSRMGATYLGLCLNRILMHHIKESVPGLKSQVNSMVTELQKELQQYGDPILQQKATQGALVLHLLSKFCNSFCDAIDGKGNDSSATIELYGGARISFIFHGIYARGLSEINPFDELTDQDIRTAIRNATGPRPSLFVPEISFEILSKNQIQRLKEPSIQCVDLVFDELQRVAMQCETPEIIRFELLRDKIVDCVNALLRRHRTPTKKMVSDLINIELAYINTNHPDFIGGSRAVSSTLDAMQRNDEGRSAEEKNLQQRQACRSHQSNSESRQHNHDNHQLPENQRGSSLPQSSRPERDQSLFSQLFGKKDKGQYNSDNSEHHLKPEKKPLSQVPKSVELSVATDREQIETQIIKSLISSYFAISRKNILDTVPKAIMHFLVNKMKEELQSELVAILYKEEKFDLLLEENAGMAQKRSQCIELLGVLTKALEIVNSVRDLKI